MKKIIFIIFILNPIFIYSIQIEKIIQVHNFKKYNTEVVSGQAIVEISSENYKNIEDKLKKNNF